MLGWVITEVVVAAVLGAALLVLYLRAKSWRTWTGRQLIAASAGVIIEMIGLAVLGLGHPLPDWAYVMIFAITDLVMVGWLVLFWKAAQAGRRADSGRHRPG